MHASKGGRKGRSSDKQQARGHHSRVMEVQGRKILGERGLNSLVDFFWGYSGGSIDLGISILDFADSPMTDCMGTGFLVEIHVLCLEKSSMKNMRLFIKKCA